MKEAKSTETVGWFVQGVSEKAESGFEPDRGLNLTFINTAASPKMTERWGRMHRVILFASQRGQVVKWALCPAHSAMAGAVRWGALAP